jgi:coenzyme F420-reducing hydrogenase gamma subunit
VMVAHGTPCLGPVVHAGCGALCPAYARGCYGCFGPMESPNTASLASWWADRGASDEDLLPSFRGINAYADAFKEESERHEHRG